MIDSRRLIRARSRLAVVPVRFMREVCASVVATAIVTAAFAGLWRGPSTPRLLPNASSKVLDRLSWDVETEPTPPPRVSRTIAMFSLPQADATPWSPIAPGSVARGLAPARAASEAPPTLVSTLRPSGPVPRRLAAAQPERVPVPPARTNQLRVAERSLQAASAAPVAALRDEPEEPRGYALLGWTVPGSDLLPTRDTARTGVARVAEKVASLGGTVANVGGTLAETIGLK